jgi:hypothetical protein
MHGDRLIHRPKSWGIDFDRKLAARRGSQQKLPIPSRPRLRENPIASEELHCGI